jgi:hypothetical protein
LAGAQANAKRSLWTRPALSRAKRSLPIRWLPIGPLAKSVCWIRPSASRRITSCVFHSEMRGPAATSAR